MLRALSVNQPRVTMMSVQRLKSASFSSHISAAAEPLSEYRSDVVIDQEVQIDQSVVPRDEHVMNID
jgi:hypothetical protein